MFVEAVNCLSPAFLAFDTRRASRHEPTGASFSVFRSIMFPSRQERVPASSVATL